MLANVSKPRLHHTLCSCRVRMDHTRHDVEPHARLYRERDLADHVSRVGGDHGGAHDGAGALLAMDFDEPAVVALWKPVATSGNEWQSVAISGNQWQSSDLPFEDDSIVMLQRRHIGVNGDAARRRLGLRQPDSGQLRLGVATSRHIRHEPGHLPRVGQSVAISGSQWRSVGISANQARAPRAGAPATCRQRARSGRRALPSRQRRA